MELLSKKKKPLNEKESKKILFYSLDAMDKIKAQFKMIIGERSNGKSFAVLERILSNYCKDGSQGAIIRRWDTDIKPMYASTFFNGVVDAGLVTKYTNGLWTGIVFKVGKWYLSKWDDDLDKKVVDETPFAYAFALTTMEHNKSTSYPNITTILFDEFLSRNGYLPDEFHLFTNTLSTIIRYRDNVQIYMLGNTVNKTSPYFKEMGIKNIDKLKQGEITIVEYGATNLKLALEYCEPLNKEGKPSDVYFAFDNPKLKMITGGAWEMEIYPHCPCKYKYSDIRFTYFIIWEDTILQCEIIKMDDTTFTFIHEKTTPLQDEKHDLIYCPEQSVLKNWCRKITVAKNAREQKVQWYFKNDKVFYQDNEIGEIVRNYLQWCKQN